MSKLDKLMDFIKGRVVVANATAYDLFPADGEAIPEWVQLLPLTGFTGRDGRGPFYYTFNEVLSAFIANGLDLPIDLDHQSLNASEKVGPAGMAIGWIKEVAMRADGLYGRVEWTGLGAGLLADKAYKYLSPVFVANKDGTITRLVGAGLVPYPNLDINPVMHTEALEATLATLIFETNPETGDIEMNIQELAQILGLEINAETPATPEQVIEALKGLQTQLVEANTELEALKASTAEATATVEANSQLVASKQGELEAMATQLTAMATKLAEADAELSTFKAEQAEKDLQAKLEALVANGKLLPAQVAGAKAIAEKAGFDALEALVANSNFAGLTTPTKAGSEQPDELSDALKGALKIAGVSVAAYLKTKNAHA